ncbi:MAG: Ig-like domain-containing protein [Muribaculaceae bacterium]|nr:Ig-like domain-containing protein [Muribaculaceae bacterium]
MKRIYFVPLVLLLLTSFQLSAIELKVGERTTLYLSNPPQYLAGCIWTSSHPFDVVFDPTPASYATSATIKAVRPLDTTSPCIIHCEYKYNELDPISGRYIYQRSGYQDWYVYVKANDPTSVTITPASTSIFVGERARLEATIYPSNASTTLDWWLDKVDGDAFYTQSQQSVINVTGEAPGVVYANVRTSNGLTARCKITINSKDPTSISITSPGTMIVGDRKTLYPSIQPPGATTSLTWKSSDDRIVEVSNGVLIAKSKGTAKITVTTHNGKTSSCDVTVKNAPEKPTSIKIPPTLTVYTSVTKTIDVTLAPDDAESTLKWSSSDSNIASVSTAGKVTGKNAGKATITVTTANNLSASCEVTVIEMPAGLTSSKIQNKINNVNNLLNRTINKVPTSK